MSWAHRATEPSSLFNTCNSSREPSPLACRYPPQNRLKVGIDPEHLQRIAAEPHKQTEIVECYLDQLFAGEAGNSQHMPYEAARPKSMPRIQPESFLEGFVREHVAHVPFLNNTVITFVTDLPLFTVSITVDEVIRWGVSIEEIEYVARKNLEHESIELS